MKFSKKLFILFIASILLFSAFSISAFASDTNDLPVFKINESFTEITLGEDTYVPVDATNLSATYKSLEVDFWIDSLLKDTVKDVKVRISTNKVLLDVTIYFVGGTSMNVSYINNDCSREYTVLLEESDIQIEDFPSFGAKEPFCFTTYELKASIPKNPDVTLDRQTLWECEEYEIIKKSDNLTMIRGFIIVDKDGNFYYADCEGSEIDRPTNFSIYTVDELNVYKLKDSELLTKMKTLVEEEKALQDKSSVTLTTTFLIIFCGIIPLVTAILCFVFSFKSKKSYKTILRVLSLLSVAEMITAVVTLIVTLS